MGRQAIKTPPRCPEGTPRMVEGKVFLLIGIFFLATAFSFRIYQTWQAQRLSFSSFPLKNNSSSDGGRLERSGSHDSSEVELIQEADLPVRVIIPKVKIDLAVSSAKVTNNQWRISETGASYLLGSGIPGKDGNTVIYGHNQSCLFGPIKWLAKGDEIKVINKKGEEFVYQLVETKTVSPKQVEVLAPTKDATLTLYTCTGFLDRERLVVKTKLF